MTAPKVIWAEPGMPGYTDEPCKGYTKRYIRADAPELVALINAAMAVNHDSTHGNGLEGFRKNRDRLRIALDQWDAMQ